MSTCTLILCLLFVATANSCLFPQPSNNNNNNRPSERQNDNRQPDNNQNDPNRNRFQNNDQNDQNRNRFQNSDQNLRPNQFGQNDNLNPNGYQRSNNGQSFGQSGDYSRRARSIESLSSRFGSLFGRSQGQNGANGASDAKIRPDTNEMISEDLAQKLMVEHQMQEMEQLRVRSTD